MKRLILYAILLTSVGCIGSCDGFFSTGPSSTKSEKIQGTPTPTPTPTPIATPTPTPTPDPCNPVTGVIVHGPTEALVKDSLAFDVTPVSAAGKLEGKYDYCNEKRTPTIERVSANLTLSGSVGWGTTFVANSKGAFEIQFRVDGAVSPVFQGIIK